MKLELNTLYWDNVDPRIEESHKKVVEHFDLDVNYHRENKRHGLWMDRVMKESTSDVVGFLDGDCVPLSKQAVIDAAVYAAANNSFIGIAQVSNHIPPMTHIYAAPAFFFVSRKFWNKLGVSFSESFRGDVGEEFTYKAEQEQVKYRCIYPTTFEKEPEEGLWPLHNYGYYGIGTTFGNYCYHLYQGRNSTNIELFAKRCQEIIDGTFSTNNMTPSTILNYKGKIVR
jgi:hypothetical protein